MKYAKQLMVVLIAALAITSCKKSTVSLTPLASLNLTNAVVGGTTVKLGSYATTLSNGAFTVYGLVAGSNSLYIYPATDSLHPYYNSSLSTGNGDVYSLFLAGTATTTVDAIVVKETIPYRTDSTAGIRFINLSPNSNPLSITLAATPTVNELTGLAYKQYTDFKTYPGLYNSAYTFQVRDASTASPSAPLATFTLSASTVPRFANITVVIKGNSPALSTLRVNNDR